MAYNLLDKQNFEFLVFSYNEFFSNWVIETPLHAFSLYQIHVILRNCTNIKNLIKSITLNLISGHVVKTTCKMALSKK